MPLNQYECARCKERVYRFDKTPTLGDGNCGKVLRWCHEWRLLPPRPKVVIATALYMQDYQLDSWPTTYELDRLLNIEAREEKEAEFYQKYLQNR